MVLYIVFGLIIFLLAFSCSNFFQNEGAVYKKAILSMVQIEL
ncbi:hypothetical protein ACFL23_03325 [Patescibacteria group bacterium]